MPNGTCTVDGCDTQELARGMCNKHYHRWLKHGDPSVVAKSGPKPGATRRPTIPCSIDGCERQTKGRGWCNTHYERWRTKGDPGGATIKPAVHPNSVCAVEGCERPTYGKGWCQPHYRRWRQTGDTGDVEVQPHYKGQAIGYDAAHKRVYATRGGASEFACTECGRQAQDWAYDNCDPDESVVPDGKNAGLRYSADPMHYQPMCKSCHTLFDLKAQRDDPKRDNPDPVPG